MSLFEERSGDKSKICQKLILTRVSSKSVQRSLVASVNHYRFLFLHLISERNIVEVRLQIQIYWSNQSCRRHLHLRHCHPFYDPGSLFAFRFHQTARISATTHHRHSKHDMSDKHGVGTVASQR